MILNIVLLLIGALALFYGLKEKLRFWIVIGVILLCFGLFSAYIDARTMGIESGANPNSRVPFIIDHFMR